MVNADAFQSPALASSRRSRPVLRGIGAVFGGLAFVFAVTTATDVVMHTSGVFPPMGGPPMGSALFLLALSYRLIFGVAGGYLTARLAPARPMRHALILGGVGLALSIAGAAAMWDAGPAWYPIAVAASALPCAWLGARLWLNRHQQA